MLKKIPTWMLFVPVLVVFAYFRAFANRDGSLDNDFAGMGLFILALTLVLVAPIIIIQVVNNVRYVSQFRAAHPELTVIPVASNLDERTLAAALNVHHPDFLDKWRNRVEQRMLIAVSVDELSIWKFHKTSEFHYRCVGTIPEESVIGFKATWGLRAATLALAIDTPNGPGELFFTALGKRATTGASLATAEAQVDTLRKRLSA